MHFLLKTLLFSCIYSTAIRFQQLLMQLLALKLSTGNPDIKLLEIELAPHVQQHMMTT